MNLLLILLITFISISFTNSLFMKGDQHNPNEKRISKVCEINKNSNDYIKCSHFLDIFWTFKMNMF